MKREKIYTHIYNKNNIEKKSKKDFKNCFLSLYNQIKHFIFLLLYSIPTSEKKKGKRIKVNFLIRILYTRKKEKLHDLIYTPKKKYIRGSLSKRDLFNTKKSNKNWEYFLWMHNLIMSKENNMKKMSNKRRRLEFFIIQTIRQCSIYFTTLPVT